MHVVKSYPDGIFNWVDLSTTDIEGAKKFYSALFDWEAVDIPIGDGAEYYTMFRLNGHNVAGGGSLPPEMQAQGIPPNWTSYVKHDNADAIAQKVTAAGGMLTVPPMDVMEEGRMMMALDPTGASFGVWQPKDHIGAQVVNVPNALVWNELQTRDTEAARSFYGAVFGWDYATDENGYVMCKTDGRVQAGMMAMDDSWGDIPASWSVYFMTDDVEAKVAKVSELGGSILVPLTAAGEMGKFAVVQDPQGGVFTIMQFNGPGDPPPG
ncbi:MAG: VOC family protein [Chloroflexi bacterium]|nr:VOC family protein [Chloroflexota bacterium]MBP7042848.1 VOC family protein [Chloroflexota bacterium]